MDTFLGMGTLRDFTSVILSFFFAVVVDVLSKREVWLQAGQFVEHGVS